MKINKLNTDYYDVKITSGDIYNLWNIILIFFILNNNNGNEQVK